MVDLRNKRVLVTGGATRIGAAIGRDFVATGAMLVIHCRESKDAAMAMAQELGNGVKVVTADFSCAAETAQLFDSIGAPVDILVNNASRYQPHPLLESDEAKDDFEVNFFAPLELMRIFYRQCRGDGVIINVLDQEIGQTRISSGSYGLSRKALLEATLAAAVEMAPAVRVNALALGPVMPPPGCEHYTMEKTLRTVPLRRKVELEDVVAGCRFLATNNSITGQVLYIDGGQHLQ